MSVEEQESILLAEETYRIMFLNAQTGLFRTGIDSGLLLDANDCLARFLGYRDRQEILATPFNITERYVDPRERQRIISLLQKHGEFRNFEARFKRKDGSIAWLRYSSKLVPQKGWIEGIAEDITKEKALEESLRESEEKYRSLVENSHDIIYTLTTDGVFTFVSPAWTVLLGHPTNQVVGQSFQPFIHPDDMANCMAWMQKMAATGKRLENVEYRVRHSDGSWRWHTSSAVSLRDEAGTVVGFEGLARDITERKRAEESLAREQFLLQALMNNLPDYVYFKDRDSRFIRINRAHARLFAVGDPAQAVGRTDFDFFTTEHARQAYEDEQAIIRTGQPVSKEERETWADRPDSWVLTTKMPLRDEKGNVIGTFGISRDITERKQAEEEIRRQLAEKETLLREVHHRIKNNIASIIGLLTMHLHATTHPEAVAALQDAIGRLDSMHVLYDKLMLSESFKKISVKSFIESLADLVIALFPGSARVRIEKRIADFHLDAKRLFPLGIIINEILTNKMKYAFADRDSGAIEIILAEMSGHVTLTIRDNGLGLPEGFAANEAKGFGLTLVQMLSRQLGGSFSMEKQAGTCCTIEFDL